MDTFPAFYPLAGRRVVIAGDGEGARAKARLFVGAPAEVVRLVGAQALDPAAYAGADLIFVASYDNDFVTAAAAAARRVGAPLNVVDHPELSDFHTPAIVDRGAVVAAIGTAGAAPLMASLLRAELELRIPEAAGALAALLGARRYALRVAFTDLPLRRAFLRSVLAGLAAEAAVAGDLALAGARLDAAIASGFVAGGRVSLLGVPTAPDLISLRAIRALNTADIVVAGPDSAAIVSAHARRDAEHWGWDRADLASLRESAAAGRLIALVGKGGAPDLADSLAASGLRVDRLAPAPAA